MEILNFVRTWWDRLAAWAAIGIGLLALLLGYLGVSDTPYVAKQLPYFISGGLFGIFMLGLGALLWISADLRDEWREIREVRSLLAERVANDAAQREAPSIAADPVEPEVNGRSAPHARGRLKAKGSA